METLVLLSGGIDSSACVNHYVQLSHQVRALFIDYGHPANGIEYRSAQKIADYYHVPLDLAVFQGTANLGAGEIQGRNAFLLLAAILYYPGFSGLLSIGVHAGTAYYDCTPEFISDIERIILRYTDGRLRLDAPFIDWDKASIYEYCRISSVPTRLTYSCEAGTLPPCGKCNSCLDREVLGDVR
jgi:7-cyano-7-deazaguanine synthase